MFLIFTFGCSKKEQDVQKTEEKDVPVKTETKKADSPKPESPKPATDDNKSTPEKDSSNKNSDEGKSANQLNENPSADSTPVKKADELKDASKDVDKKVPTTRKPAPSKDLKKLFSNQRGKTGITGSGGGQGGYGVKGGSGGVGSSKKCSPGDPLCNLNNKTSGHRNDMEGTEDAD